jgi:hypothetical protein
MNLSSAQLASIRATDPERYDALKAVTATQAFDNQEPAKFRGGVAALRAVRVAGRMTKTERLFANRLDMQKSANVIRGWKYERVNFKLDDPETGRAINYRPDFLVWNLDGSVTLIEVKGGWIAEKGMLKFRIAMSLYPEFRFELWQFKGSVWTLLRESCSATTRTRV